MRLVPYGVTRPAVCDELKVCALHRGAVIEGLSTGTCTFASEFKTEGKRRADLSIYRKLQAVTGCDVAFNEAYPSFTTNREMELRCCAAAFTIGGVVLLPSPSACQNI